MFQLMFYLQPDSLIIKLSANQAENVSQMRKIIKQFHLLEHWHIAHMLMGAVIRGLLQETTTIN